MCIRDRGKGEGGKGNLPDQQNNGGAKGKGTGGKAFQGQRWKCYEVGRWAVECFLNQGKAPV
eukprot:4787066-Alexandrium_andersonii.AAC.1